MQETANSGSGHCASFSLVVWNIDWAGEVPRRREAVRTEIARRSPDLVVLTEADEAILADYHVVSAKPDYGYGLSARRKVVIFSRFPWRDVDRGADSGLPPGRFVAGTTTTTLGDIRVAGVCVPWRMAHVSTGNRNRAPWEEHNAYLKILPSRLTKLPDVLAGDFNQTFPPSRGPGEAQDNALDALSGLRVRTEAVVGSDGKPLIDHVATSARLDRASLTIIDRCSPDGRVLSDHDGLHTTIVRSP